MAHGNTTNLNLKKLDPTARMSLSDLRAFFEANQDTIDANIKALFERIEAVAVAGYTPIQPVNLPDSALKVRIENAATLFDIPALLASLPTHTPVRITGFTMTLTSIQALTEFYELLDTLHGLDASNGGLDKVQMNGTVRLAGTSDTITVTGAQMRAWERRYPSITIIPQRIENKVYYYNFDGSELLHTETVYDEADATYAAIPSRVSAESGHMYSFLGWSTSANSATANAVLTGVSEDKTVYAAYAYLEDVAPTLSVTTYSASVGNAAVIEISDWGAYNKVTSLTALNASGTATAATPGSAILSVDGDTVTVTPDDGLYNGSNWALTFSDTSGSCTRSVPFNLRNLPVVTVRKTSSGNGDAAVIEVSKFGDFPNVTGYTCAYTPVSS